MRSRLLRTLLGRRRRVPKLERRYRGTVLTLACVSTVIGGVMVLLNAGGAESDDQSRWQARLAEKAARAEEKSAVATTGGVATLSLAPKVVLSSPQLVVAARVMPPEPAASSRPAPAPALSAAPFPPVGRAAPRPAVDFDTVLGLEPAGDVEAPEPAAAVEIANLPERSSRRPAWLRNVAGAPPPSGRPRIAVVIDDLGLNRPATAGTIALDAPITLGFIPYAGDLHRQTRNGWAAGHEVILHMPMEPVGSENPGPNALLADLPPGELRDRLRWAIARVGDIVGISNHMGSQLTADRAAMTEVMRELRARGLLYLDSRTTESTIAADEAARQGVPHASRHVFLDHDPEPRMVWLQLDELERMARRLGSAIGIGHPYPATLAILETWLPDAKERGFELVPLSAIVAHESCRAGTHPEACTTLAGVAEDDVCGPHKVC